MHITPLAASPRTYVNTNGRFVAKPHTRAPGQAGVRVTFDLLFRFGCLPKGAALAWTAVQRLRGDSKPASDERGSLSPCCSLLEDRDECVIRVCVRRRRTLGCVDAHHSTRHVRTLPTGAAPPPLPRPACCEAGYWELAELSAPSLLVYSTKAELRPARHKEFCDALVRRGKTSLSACCSLLEGAAYEH